MSIELLLVLVWLIMYVVSELLTYSRGEEMAWQEMWKNTSVNGWMFAFGMLIVVLFSPRSIYVSLFYR